jgi:hypothetical protein
MSKIIVDSIQTTGGTAFSLPTSDGSAGGALQTDGSGNLSFAAAAAAPSTVPDDDYRVIGSLVTSSSRDNVYSTGEWSSSGPWTTYYHSWHNDVNSRIQGVNMAMGDGYPDDGATTQNMYSDDGMHNERKEYDWAYNSRLGFRRKDYFEYDNQTNQYAGVVWRMLPLRNTTASNITRTFSCHLSAYNNDYAGACVFMATPDDTTYSGTTATTWTDVDGGNAGNSDNNFGDMSITFPANKTVVLFMCSSTRYETTYRMKNTNTAYNLHTLCPSTGDLVCDLRMLETMRTTRALGATYTSDTFWKYYTNCAAIYGDR